MKKLNEIFLSCLTLMIILSSSCHEEVRLLEFGEDFFCDEDQPAVFIRFEIDGEDVFIDQGSAANIDLCDISTNITSIHEIEAIVNDDFILSGSQIALNSKDFFIRIHLIGALFKSQLDANSDRDYGDQILANEFQYRKVAGTEQFDTGELGTEIPSERQSLISFEISPNIISPDVRYKTEAPRVSLEFPFFLEDFQTNSFFTIDDIEEIDYVSPDYPDVKYNYILCGTFECRIYREGSAEKYLDLKNGSFRLPIHFRSTSDVL